MSTAIVMATVGAAMVVFMFNSGSGILPVMNVDGNRDGNGWGGDGGWWVLIILFALFGGWGNNGWGGNRSDGGSCCTPATCADLQRGFDNQTTQQRFNGIDQGICSLGYDNATLINGVNTNIMQTGFGITNAIQSNAIASMQQSNALQAQLADCCCTTQRSIDQVRFDNAQNTCAITTQMNQGFAQLDRTINDQFCQLKMEQKDATIAEQQNLINALNLAQSQANQNQYLIDQLRPCPTPSYITCNPWATNGTAYTSCGCNTGCGC